MRRRLRHLIRFARLALALAVLWVATAPSLAPAAEVWAETAAWIAPVARAETSSDRELPAVTKTAPRADRPTAATIDVPALRVSRRALPSPRLFLRNCAFLC